MVEEGDDVHVDCQIGRELVERVGIKCRGVGTNNEHVSEFSRADDCANPVDICLDGVCNAVDGVFVEIGRRHDDQ